MEFGQQVEIISDGVAYRSILTGRERGNVAYGVGDIAALEDAVGADYRLLDDGIVLRGHAAALVGFLTNLDATFEKITGASGSGGASTLMRSTEYFKGDFVTCKNAPGWVTLYCTTQGVTDASSLTKLPLHLSQSSPISGAAL